ncbi:MAG: PIN domain-containing protein [Candidatus Gracilibacteria bacterium]|jgi:predicted nucleic acid-binding protein
MIKLFLDANILFAATASISGGSRALFDLAQKKLISLVSSEYALHEAKINIEKKLGHEKLVDFYKLVSWLTDVYKKPLTKSELSAFQEIIVAKDIPILAGAKKLEVDFLITLDKKDFQNMKMKATKFPFQILSPGDFLRAFPYNT